MAELGAVGKAEKIVELLGDEDEQAQRYAIEALGRLGYTKSIPKLVALLDHPEPLTRKYAVRILGDLKAQEAGKRIIGLLGDADEGLRVEAASSLCKMGRKVGVPVLIKESRGTFYLNSIRQPAVWNEMDRLVIPHNVEGTFKEIIESLARNAELGLEWTWGVHGRGEYWGSERREVNNRRGKASVLEALQIALNGRFEERGPYEAILEHDRIRIVSRHEALQFWRSWWAKEQKKQPKK